MARAALDWFLWSLVPPAVALAASVLHGFVVGTVVGVTELVRDRSGLRDASSYLAIGPGMSFAVMFPVVILCWPPVTVAALGTAIVVGARAATRDVHVSALVALVGSLSLLASRYQWLWVRDAWWETLHLEFGIILVSVAVIDRFVRWSRGDGRRGWKHNIGAGGVTHRRVIGGARLAVSGPPASARSLMDLLDNLAWELAEAQGAAGLWSWRSGWPARSDGGSRTSRRYHMGASVTLRGNIDRVAAACAVIDRYIDNTRDEPER